MNWRYMLNGQTLGPVDLTTLQGLVDSGSMTGETLVQREGSSEWIPAKSVAEIRFPQSTGTSTTGAPPPQIGQGTSSDSDAEDIDKNKIFAVVAYLGILCIVPLLAVPQSKFARYHANQGVVLLIATVILVFGSMILAMIPIIGCLSYPIAMIAMVGAFILMIMGILNAASGKYKPLPLIGHFQLLK